MIHNDARSSRVQLLGVQDAVWTRVMILNPWDFIDCLLAVLAVKSPHQ
jgi:hypothetical protein